METKNIRYYEIVKEQSPYKKAPLWYWKEYRQDGSLRSSFGYKTEKEAKEVLERSKKSGQQGFLVGNDMVYISYVPKSSMQGGVI